MGLVVATIQLKTDSPSSERNEVSIRKSMNSTRLDTGFTIRLL
nr:MAG TPA: hypothetical protein [Caudoviricetes sp.]